MANIITSKTLNKIAKEAKLNRRDFLKICAAAGIGTGIGTLTGCNKPSGGYEPISPPEPPPSGKEILTGKITSIFGGPYNTGIRNVTIECSEDSATTDGTGRYAIYYTKGTTPLLTITHQDYVTRKTFPQYGPDYKIIPTPSAAGFFFDFSMEEFNNICRSQPHGTERWALESSNKPSVYITTDDNPEPYLKDLIEDIVQRDIPQMTHSVLSGLAINEGLYNNRPARDAIVYHFMNNSTGLNTIRELDATATIYYAIIMIGGEAAIKRGVLSRATGRAIGFSGNATSAESLMYPHPSPFPDRPTQLDINNGILLYDRPTMNKDPDNDPTPSDAVFSYQTYQDALEQEPRSIFDLLDTDRMTRSLQKPDAWIRYEQKMQEIQMRQQRELAAYKRANKAR